MEIPKEMKAWRAHAYGAEGNPADTIGKMSLDTVGATATGWGSVGHSVTAEVVPQPKVF